MVPFMKSREFVNYYFFEALDEIAVTHFQRGVLHSTIVFLMSGIPTFLIKKKKTECISLVMTILIFCLQNQDLKTASGVVFMPHKGYNKNMDRSLNYEKILISPQIENTEGKVRNTRL